MNTLLAPNGKPSNLTKEQHALVRTIQFISWFGDWINNPQDASKVVDENGEPLVVYHGSEGKIFNVFDKEKQVFGHHGKGFYFANKDYVESYYGKGKYKSFFLNIRNLFDLYNTYSKVEIKKIFNKDYFQIEKMIDEELEISFDGKVYGNLFYAAAGNDKLIKAKYDGLKQDYVYVAFEPNQIKLATGENTAFDPKNNDIRFKEGGMTTTGRLLAPNGKPSNLTPEQYKLVRSPQFISWFGDFINNPEDASKIVDENGEPMVVYHYSSTDFTVFDKKKHPKINSLVENKSHKALGYDFSTKEGFYKTGYRNILYSCFLNVRNPFDYRHASEQQKKELQDILSQIPYYKNSEFNLNIALKELNEGHWSVLELPSIEKYLSKKYDGLVMEENGWSNIKVYSSNQIKLATGENTAFDPTNDDIRFKEGGMTTTSELLAPNGKPSNLTPEQYKLVRTPQFISWFGDFINNPEDASKIVDENGEPMVVYHGTNDKFNEFSLEKVGANTDYGMWGKGFYFSPSRKFSKHYGDIIIRCFLNIKNPLIINPEKFKTPEDFKPVYGEDHSEILRNKLLSSGYDGVIQYERGEKNPLTQIVGFQPNQIKLATGENTEFDPKNNDMRYKEGGMTTTEKLLAPNGKPSNLTPEQYNLVRTPQFIAWFGDFINDPHKASKAVDENGEPNIFWHGTNNEFTTFSNKGGSSHDMGYYGQGFYFTFAVGSYRSYAKGEAAYYGGIVKPYFLRFLNPFDISTLSVYDGISINAMSYESMVFLLNIAIKYPSIANQIKLDKKTYNSEENEYEIEEVSISVLPELFNKYKPILNIWESKDYDGRTYKSGYVKSEIVKFTRDDGTEHSYLSTEDLGRVFYQINDGKQFPSDKEIECYLIIDAIEKHDGISSDYHPEGYMTRYPVITDAIKENHDGILQSIYGDEAVVFEPNQIKLATGENTAFDNNNPDTRYAAGGKIPDVIDYIHNTEKAPYFGSRYGQDVEPSGYYVRKKELDFNPPGWEQGTVEFKHPLIIPVTEDDLVSWKYKLSKDYSGKRGKALTKSLMANGYDGIITQYPEGDMGEIIVFENAKTQKLKFENGGPINTDMYRKTQNFTQFAIANGYPSDYDVLNHGRLGSSGYESKRSKAREMDAHLERLGRNKEAHRLYEEAIAKGEIIDPDGKITTASLNKDELDAEMKKLEGKKLQLTRYKENLEHIYKVKLASPRPNNTKKTLQMTIDELQGVNDAIDALKQKYSNGGQTPYNVYVVDGGPALKSALKKAGLKKFAKGGSITEFNPVFNNKAIAWEKAHGKWSVLINGKRYDQIKSEDLPKELKEAEFWKYADWITIPNTKKEPLRITTFLPLMPNSGVTGKLYDYSNYTKEDMIEAINNHISFMDKNDKDFPKYAEPHLLKMANIMKDFLLNNDLKFISTLDEINGDYSDSNNEKDDECYDIYSLSKEQDVLKNASKKAVQQFVYEDFAFNNPYDENQIETFEEAESYLDQNGYLLTKCIVKNTPVSGIKKPTTKLSKFASRGHNV